MLLNEIFVTKDLFAKKKHHANRAMNLLKSVNF